MWTPPSSLSDQPLSSALVWISLLDLPPLLCSLDEFEFIASGVGIPIPSTSVSTPPIGVGAPKVRAVVPLNKGPLPSTVLVEDDHGFQVPVVICYLNLPPLCPTCALYGHRSHRCPQRHSSPHHVAPVPVAHVPASELQRHSSPHPVAPVAIAPDPAIEPPPALESPPSSTTPAVMIRSARSAVLPLSVQSVRTEDSKTRSAASLGHYVSGPDQGPSASSQSNYIRVTPQAHSTPLGPPEPDHHHPKSTILLQPTSLQALVSPNKAQPDNTPGPIALQPTTIIQPPISHVNFPPTVISPVINPAIISPAILSPPTSPVIVSPIIHLNRGFTRCSGNSSDHLCHLQSSISSVQIRSS